MGGGMGWRATDRDQLCSKLSQANPLTLGENVSVGQQLLHTFPRGNFTFSSGNLPRPMVLEVLLRSPPFPPPLLH